MDPSSKHRPLPEIPELEDTYTLVRELGRGGSAVVYLARERELGRDVAIKLIRTAPGADEEAMARLTREARTVGKLQHPNIVMLLGTRRLSDGSLALVLQFVPGRTLKERIREEGPLPLDDAVGILDEVARGLGYAHRNRIVHRDVKPENVYLDEDAGIARLADFGIARPWDSDSGLTLPGTAIGTPAYMAPEQVEGGAVDGRSDLYSLGLLAWEMLTGRAPWEGESLYGIIYKQKHEELPSLTELRPDTPGYVVQAIERALRKEPERRWPSADAFLAALAPPAPLATEEEPQSEPAFEPVQTGEASRPPTPPSLDEPVPEDPEPGEMPAHTPESREPPEFPGSGKGSADHPPDPGSETAGADPSPGEAGDPSRKRSGMGAAALFGLVLMGVVVGGFAAGAPDQTLRSVFEGLAPFASERDSPSDPAGAPNSPDAILPDATPGPGPPARADGEDRAPLGITDPTGGARPDGEGPTFDPPFASAFPSDLPAGGEEAPATATGGALPDPPEREDASEPDADPEDAEEASPDPEDPQDTEEPASDAPPPPTPRAEDPLAVRAMVVAGESHTCMLTSEGRTGCWGANVQGQLGDGSRAARPDPGSWLSGRFTQLTSGRSHVCALDPEGRPFCWGGNDHGQIGDGTTESRPGPTPVEAVPRLVELSTGSHHTCGSTEEGEVYCWGANQEGQLGDGTTEPQLRPVQVAASVDLREVTAGEEHTCALDGRGRAYCWGSNDSGQLGRSTQDPLAPTTSVSSTITFEHLSAGRSHTCGLEPDGRAHCWGANQHGQLGDGTTGTRRVPTLVQPAPRFTRVVAGGDHTCAIGPAEEAYCWGHNAFGQLGDGTRTSRDSPTPVPGGAFEQIDASNTHTCGRTPDGETRCWGRNTDGQLGDGSRHDRAVPARIGVVRPP